PSPYRLVRRHRGVDRKQPHHRAGSVRGRRCRDARDGSARLPGSEPPGTGRRLTNYRTSRTGASSSSATRASRPAALSSGIGPVRVSVLLYAPLWLSYRMRPRLMTGTPSSSTTSSTSRPLRSAATRPSPSSPEDAPSGPSSSELTKEPNEVVAASKTRLIVTSLPSTANPVAPESNPLLSAAFATARNRKAAAESG